MDGFTITDIVWNSNDFVLNLQNTENTTFNNGENEFSEKPSKPSKSFVDTTEYKKLVDIKNKIPNCVFWDKWSKLLNPYDKVVNIAKHKNSRDYYKYLEIFKYCDLIKDIPEEECSSIHIGLSSLSFVKALSYFRNSDWHAEGINTGISNENHDLKISESDLDFYKSKDLDGNTRIINNLEKLDHIENLQTFKNLFSDKKINIFSGDITIDTSHDPNNREQLSFHLFLSQVSYALRVQKIGGHLIIKIFDTMTRPTCQLIYYLTNFYGKVEVIKPRTSRYSNSEKYVVAKHFTGIDNTEIYNLDIMLKNWKKDLYCRVLCIDVPDTVKQQFYNYNQKLIDIQYNYVEKIIKCSYNEEEIPEKILEGYQIKKAHEFCSNFGILVNLLDKVSGTMLTCKHHKKNKIKINHLKHVFVCEICLCLLITKV